FRTRRPHVDSITGTRKCLTSAPPMPILRGSAASCVQRLAQVAELVDAPASGAGEGNLVEVRVFSWAPPSERPASCGPFVCPALTARHHPPPAAQMQGALP